MRRGVWCLEDENGDGKWVGDSDVAVCCMGFWYGMECRFFLFVLELRTDPMALTKKATFSSN